MTFLYPSFLYALALVTIPVIIHFFNFRRFKKQEFTQVKFLKEATQVKKRFRRIRDLLIMFLRMLAIACLVIAFAHPIPEGIEAQNTQGDLVSIYIDNSFSMALEGENGQLLGEAVQKVEQLVEGFGENALFNLVTNDLDGISDDFVQKSVFLQSLESISETSQTPQAKDIYFQQRNSLISRNGNRRIIWLSDFQKSAFRFSPEMSDTLIDFYTIPIASESVQNIGVDSVWFDQGLFEIGQEATLKVTVSNYGGEEATGRSIYATVNGVQRAIQTVDLAPGESKELSLSFSITEEGWNLLKVSLEDYPIEFDNDFYTGFYVDPTKSIVNLYTQQVNPYLNRVFNTSKVFSFQQTALSQVESNSLDRHNLIILDEFSEVGSGTIDQLKKAVYSGSNLVILPSDGRAADVVGQFGLELSEVKTENLEIKNLELEDPFFADIFESVPSNASYPKVFKYFDLRIKTRTQAKALITLNNGIPFLTETTYGQGRVFVLNGTLNKDWNSLFKNALFVPLMYKFASYSGGQNAIGHFIDEVPTQVPYKVEMNKKVLGLFSGQTATIPHQSVRQDRLNIYEEEVKEQGFYELKEMEKPDTVYHQLGFNFPRKESDLTFWTYDDLKAFGEQLNMKIIDGSDSYLGGTFRDINDKNRLWRYFIMAALCFLIFEIIAIKLLLR